MPEESATRTVPPEEKRGGDHPDWAGARPGEELPELAPDQCGGGCGNPGCEPGA